ncbi:hypothetical protein ACLKA6_004648 [Drosophila palustris]
MCGLPACPHDNLLCMKSAPVAAFAAFAAFAMFFAQFAKAMLDTKQICRAAVDETHENRVENPTTTLSPSPSPNPSFAVPAVLEQGSGFMLRPFGPGK